MKVRGQEARKKRKTLCGSQHMSVSSCNRSVKTSSLAKCKAHKFGSVIMIAVGISGISKDEASHLLNKTLPAPKDPDTYMIQLEVFHNLHCLNMLRKTLYPEQYPDMVAYHDNGTINHGTLQALHMGKSTRTLLSLILFFFLLSMNTRTDILPQTTVSTPSASPPCARPTSPL